MSDVDLPLPHDRSAAPLARAEVRRRLAGVLDPARLTDLVLVVVELVTNAVMHGRGDIRLRLRLDGRNVRGEVIDGGGGFEHRLRAVGPEQVSGRGLLLVDRLTTRWGVHEGTTHVWFELLAGPPEPGGGPGLGPSSRPPQLP